MNQKANMWVVLVYSISLDMDTDIFTYAVIIRILDIEYLVENIFKRIFLERY